MATVADSTDAELLGRFVRQKDLAAFEALLKRHGPMVYQVCLRVLQRTQDAEDAFQATFVVLVKKAASIGRPDQLAGWLHGVARRVALKVRAQTAQRQAREKQLPEQPVVQASDGSKEHLWSDLRPLLDEELERLPEKYRAPLVLCYLEGKTNDQAAAQLGWTRGKVAGKLSQGRELLRSRLARRGLTVTSAALASVLLQQAAQAAPVSATLGAAALQAAQGGVIAAKIAAFTEGVVVGKSFLGMKAVAVATALTLGGAAVVLMDNDAAPERAPFLSFDGPEVPRNRAGESYPNADVAKGRTGPFQVSLAEEGVAGRCLRMRLESDRLKAQFDPNEPKGRGFARDYVERPEAWRFNTYNRLRFWVKVPRAKEALVGMLLGTHVKRIAGASRRGGFDDGGNSFQHFFKVPATGQWTQVVLNMHPSRFARGGDNIGNQPHPTGEDDNNYFDGLTRFYLETRTLSPGYPADYFLDEMEFYQEPHEENDEQVFALTATHVPETGRIVVTWQRSGGDESAHEVRFAFESIHKIGWEAARPAPAGLVTPSGTGRTLLYDSDQLPLDGRVLYVAIKPEKATLFSQIAIPLTR